MDLRIFSSLAETRPVVVVAGNDDRGTGVWRRLSVTQSYMGVQRLDLADGFNITTAPKVAIRGHQLGYRPKTNAYDAWSVPMWEQYIRELAIFGTNTIELIPPRSDDADQKSAFPAAENGNDGGDVPNCGRVWLECLGVVSGDGPGLLESADGRVCAEGVGGSLPAFAALGCHFRSRRRSWPHGTEILVGAAGEAGRESCAGIIPKPRCGSRRRVSTRPGWTSSIAFSTSSPPG